MLRVLCRLLEYYWSTYGLENILEVLFTFAQVLVLTRYRENSVEFSLKFKSWLILFMKNLLRLTTGFQKLHTFPFPSADHVSFWVRVVTVASTISSNETSSWVLALLVLQFQLASSLNITFLLIITLPLGGLYSLYALDSTQ